MQLQQAYRNSRRKSVQTPSSKKQRDLACVTEKKDNPADNNEDVLDDIAYQRMCAEMQKHLQASKINENAIHKLMDASFQMRRKWISTEEFMSINKACEQFPALKYPKWVSHYNTSCNVNLSFPPCFLWRFFQCQNIFT